MAQAAAGAEPQAGFGPAFLGQGGAAFNANASCAPTSVANGLSYLYNLVPGAFTPTGTPNTFGAVNSLSISMGVTASGATYGPEPGVTGIASGTAQWLAGNATGVGLSGQYAPSSPLNPNYNNFLLGNTGGLSANFQQSVPSAVSLASFLNANDGVELGLQWGRLSGSSFTPGGGGHFVTLQSINLSLDNTVGDPFFGMYTGSISYLDPWGNPTNSAPSNVGQFVTGSLLLTSAGYLDVYNIAAQEQTIESAPADPGFGAAGLPAGQIMVDLVETVSIPDGGLTALMLSASVLGLAALRRKFC